MDGNYKLTVKTDKDYSLAVNTLGYQPLIVRSATLGAFSDLTLQQL